MEREPHDRAVDAAYEALKRGDDGAEARLYDVLKRNSKYIVIHHGGVDLDRDLAHDIATRVIEKLSTFKGRSKFSTWFYRVATNECMDALSDYIEQKRHEPPAVREPDDDENRVGELAAPKGNIDAAIDVEALSQGLPPDQAAIIRLNLEGRTLDEISQRQNIALGTARSRFELGKSKMRARVMPEKEDEEFKELSEVLSRRQLQVVRAILDGRSYEAIAADLALPIRAVRTSFYSANRKMKKLGLKLKK